MSEWDPGKYLQFQRQRTQPALDLALRLRPFCPGSIVDIGCGPGNSTAVVRSVFPHAQLLGVDSSEKMIRRAREEHPDMDFALMDAQALTGQYDLIFSNACLQWIPDHAALIPRLMQHVSPGGRLAVQVPMNQDEPLYRIIREVAADPAWPFGGVSPETNEVLDPGAYFDILSGCCASFDMWETGYYHALPAHQALIEWVRGTRLRPYLNALDAAGQRAFEQQLLQRVEAAYPPTASGEVVLKFRRFFFVAQK